MLSAAAKFCHTVNHNLGEIAMTDLPFLENYGGKLITENCTQDKMEIVFRDESKAVVEFMSSEGKPLAKELPAFVAKPFVPVSVGKYTVFTNGCGEIFVKSCEGKTVRIMISSDAIVEMTGMGNLENYDGHHVSFK